MAENIKNPLSNLSYTNKDFQTIFPEYLDLFKVLTTQYDPSSSNESDPLLILLKEQALLGDKLNYNSDKNILETFPLSVTQESNARQLYSQLGYSMNWYQAATGRVVIKYTGEKIIEEDEENRGIAALKIPIFTQITDDDNETVYTTTKEITITDDNRTSADFDKSLEDNVIQGVPVEYTINNDNIIKIDNLDSNNRIYFDDYDIAENGIFISDANQEMFTSSWTLVDNLSVESLGNKYYEFGVLPNSNTCYIEFPSDIDNLIKNGIKIIYIKTKGVQGNIAANILTQFAQTVNANYSYLGDGWASYVPSKTKTLNRENIYITNPAKIANGKDIEDLESAYNNYKKTIGVFKTLVSLRDYNNYLNTQGKKVEQCSNGFVCDRTNDIQNVYYVITGSNQLSPLETIIEKDGNNKPKIGPFDLKLYLLQYVDKPDYSSQQYDLTFYPPKTSVDSYTNENDPILKLLDETKSIQHDFKAYEAETIEDETILSSGLLYFLNKYPLNITIVPQYELTSLQQVEVTTNVIQALWSQLNSQKVDFGEEVLYETVYDIIKNADERIKAIVLNDLIFDTYAVYFDGSQYHQVLVGAETTPIGVNSDTTIENFQNEIFAKSVLKGNTPLLIPDETYKYNIIQNSVGITDPTPDTEIKSIKTNVEITVPNDNNGYSLRDNETITFIAPSLINVAQYGIYTKYFSNFTINANEETQIDDNLNDDNNSDTYDGKFIIFFWKNSEDVVYRYHYYIADDIIKSSFNITSNLTYDDINFSSGISKLINATSSGSHQGLLNVEYDNLTNANLEEVIKSSNVLSGQNYVAERKINSTELNFNTTEYPCYWITNTIETDNENNEYYVLFESKTSTAIEYQTRILMPGEYFLYSNPEKTSLVLLGSGTKITRTIAASSTVSEWKVKKTSNTDQIVSDGLKAFTEDMWFDLWKNNTVVNNISKFEIQEMQFYQFGKGYKVKSTSQQTFESDSEDVVNGAISYAEIDENGQIIGDWENLPSISLISGNWQGFTTLFLNLSQTNPISLLYGQSIEYIDKDDNSSTIEPASQEDIFKLLANMDFSILGGKYENNTVIYNYLTGQKKYLTLYVYKDITSISDPTKPVKYQYSNTDNLDGQLNIIISPGNTQEQSININGGSNGYCFSEGTYLIQLEIPGNETSDIFSSLYLKQGNTNDDKLLEYTTGNDSYPQKGLHYILYNVDGTNINNLRLLYTLSSTIDKDYIVSIKKIFKFTNTDVLSSGKFTAVKSKIITLDVDGKYDWTHIVDKDTEIDNPLSGASFMNPNHIYNKYTICQIDNGKDLGGNKTSPYIYIANRVR